MFILASIKLRRVFAFFLTFTLLLQNSLFLIPNLILAACTNNVEKRSNAGFETDLSGWSAGPSFDDSTFNDTSGAVATWPLDDATSTQSFSRVVNPAVATGRDIVLNGGFDTDTIWTKGTGWTVAGGVAHSDGTGNQASVSQATSGITVGKAYQATFTVSNYVSGSIRAVVGGTGNGTFRSANGTYTENIIASGVLSIFLQQNTTANGSFVGDIDNVSVTQLNIPAYNATPSQLLADGDMETAGTSAWTALNSATLSKQTTSPHGGSQVLRVTYNGVANAGTSQNAVETNTIYRITGYVRSDGTAMPVIIRGATLFVGTTSTSWQPFDLVFNSGGGNDVILRNNTSSGYVEFDDVVVSLDNYVRSGELLQDGDMEIVDSPSSWTSTDASHYWAAASATTNSKQTSLPQGGAQVLRVAGTSGSNAVAAQTILVVGKKYYATGFMRGDGTVVPRFGTAPSALKEGTSSTSWQPIDVTFIADHVNIRLTALTISSTGYAEFDDVSVTEVDPLVGVFTSAATTPTYPTAAGGHLTNAYSFDGSNDVVNIYSSDLNSAFNPSEGTLVAWAKVSGAGVWTDATTRHFAVIGSDSSNQITIQKSNVSNQIIASVVMGGTSKYPTSTSFSSTGWFQVALSWSKTNNQAILYVNGAQSGSTQTGLGTWVNNLSTTTTTIGASGSTGVNPWSGLINDVRLYNRALSDTEIGNLYTGGTATYDTGTKYAGTASSKLVTPADNTASFVQSVNVENTSTHTLSAFAYTDGSAVTSSDASLYYNGSIVSTTYSSIGGGWYQLTGTVAGANESRQYGVQVKAGKTVYLDNMSLNGDIPALCPANPPVCTDGMPASSPAITSTVSGTNSVTLNFSPAADPVTHYALEYGSLSGSYQYGAANIGGRDTRSYTVKSLSPGTRYYFRVRAGNGCSTGSWSAEASSTTQAGFYPQPTLTPLPAPTPLASPKPSGTPSPSPGSQGFKFPEIHLPKISLDLRPLLGLAGSSANIYSLREGIKNDISSLALVVTSIRMPKISLPSITLPKIALPTISLPQISIDARPLLGMAGSTAITIQPLNKASSLVIAFIKESVNYASFIASNQYTKQVETLGKIKDWLAYTRTSFKEIVLDTEPTQIFDVNVKELGSTSIIVYWRTNHLSTSKVNYGETLVYGKSLQSSEKVHEHEIEVTDLKPNTKYYFEVMSQNKNYVYDAYHEFMTPEEE